VDEARLVRVDTEKVRGDLEGVAWAKTPPALGGVGKGPRSRRRATAGQAGQTVRFVRTPVLQGSRVGVKGNQGGMAFYVRAAKTYLCPVLFRAVIRRSTVNTAPDGRDSADAAGVTSGRCARCRLGIGLALDKVK